MLYTDFVYTDLIQHSHCEREESCRLEHLPGDTQPHYFPLVSSSLPFEMQQTLEKGWQFLVPASGHPGKQEAAFDILFQTQENYPGK